MIRLYLDSASRAAAEPLLAGGLFHGLTTNPTILRRDGVRSTELPALVAWATAAGARTVFLQTHGHDADRLVEQGLRLRDLGEEVVVKVPATAPGLTAAVRLRACGVPVLVTAVYDGCQLLPVLATGAEYIAPYLGRMTDAGRDGRSIIAFMQATVDRLGSATRILVASVRTPADATAMASSGVRDITFGPAVWSAFFEDELTAAAVATFETDAAAVGM